MIHPTSPVRLCLLSLLVFITTSASSMAAIFAGPVINPANGHVYYLLTPNTWTASEAEAVSMGGHLVTINDAEEQAWMYSLFGPHANLWIGLNDVAEEGKFVWSSGEAVTYTNWYGAEPNGNAGENYATVWWSGYGAPFAGAWNDITNVNGYNTMGVVETHQVWVAPEPSLALLNIMAFAAVILRRRRTLRK